MEAAEKKKTARVQPFQLDRISRLLTRLENAVAELKQFHDELDKSGFKGQLKIDGGKKLAEASKWINNATARLKTAYNNLDEDE